MCVSSVLNTVYITLLIVGFGLSIASFVTPNWSKITVSKEGVQDGTVVKGLLFGCDANRLSTLKGWEACANLQNLDTAGWVTVVCFLLTFVLCILALIWSCVNCFACCCRTCLTPPLPIFSGLAFLSVTVAIAVFGFGHIPQIGPFPTDATGLEQKFTSDNSLGLSFWIGAVASLALLADTIVGIVLNKCVKVPFV